MQPNSAHACKESLPWFSTVQTKLTFCFMSLEITLNELEHTFKLHRVRHKVFPIFLLFSAIARGILVRICLRFFVIHNLYQNEIENL